MKLRDDVVDVPRVDEQRAREHLRGAGELAEDERTAPAARQAGSALWQRTNSCATRFMPSRSGVTIITSARR